MKKEKKIFFILVLLGLFIGCSSKDDIEQPEIIVEELTEEETETMCKKTWKEVENLIGEKFLSSNNPLELEPYFNEIRKMDYVKDVFCTETSVVILLENGNAWSWMVKSNIPVEGIENDDATNEVSAIPNTASYPISYNARNAVSRSSILDHISRRPDGEKLKILIFDQTTLDDRPDFKSAGETLQSLKKALEDKGIEVTFKTTNYKLDDLDKYDLCLLHTHGEYINPYLPGVNMCKQHRILTSAQASTLSLFFRYNWTTIKEMRNGELTEQHYYTLSESDIKENYSGKFKEKGTLFFVNACKSLKDNHDFSEAFIHCGASGYIGYTDVISASKCTKAAQHFFLSLLNDSTFSEAYTGIPDKYKYMKSYQDDETKETITCNSQMKYKLASDEVKSYCYGHVCPRGEHPHLIDMGNGLMWSCCNIGASDPYSPGNYYSWGETKTKTQYSIKDNEEYNKGGFTYGNDIACSIHDVAWMTSKDDSLKMRMPSYSELKFLVDNCDVTWADYGTYGGVILTSKLNGNKLFISAGGWIFEGEKLGRHDSGILWSANRAIEYMGYFMQIMYNNGNPNAHIAYSRWSGHNVRGVAVSNKQVESNFISNKK